jgi:hypothetical protein
VYVSSTDEQAFHLFIVERLVFNLYVSKSMVMIPELEAFFNFFDGRGGLIEKENGAL